MIGELRRVADHFGGAIWRRGEIGHAAKRSSGPKPLRGGAVLRNRYKVERFLFWDGRYNHYAATTAGGDEIYELMEFPNHHGIEGEMELVAKQVYFQPPIFFGSPSTWRIHWTTFTAME